MNEVNDTNTNTRTGQTVVGVFDDVTAAERAINDLKIAGFMPDTISVVTKDRQEQKDLNELAGNRAGEGALAGALGGGTLGAVLGWMLAGGTALIPGVGPVIAAGIFGATITGALVGGALGSISAALVGQGIPEDEAAEYEEHVRGGRTLLSVKAANGQQLESALDIFDRNAADGVRYYNEGQTGPGRIYSRGAMTETDTTAGSMNETNRPDHDWTSVATNDVDNAANVDRRDYAVLTKDEAAPDYRDETYRSGNKTDREESRTEMGGSNYPTTTTDTTAYRSDSPVATGTSSYDEGSRATNAGSGYTDRETEYTQNPLETDTLPKREDETRKGVYNQPRRASGTFPGDTDQPLEYDDKPRPTI